jgi:hypothetical protein
LNFQFVLLRLIGLRIQQVILTIVLTFEMKLFFEKQQHNHEAYIEQIQLIEVLTTSNNKYLYARVHTAFKNTCVRSYKQKHQTTQTHISFTSPLRQ